MCLCACFPTLRPLISEEYNISATACTPKEPDLERPLALCYAAVQPRLSWQRPHGILLDHLSDLEKHAAEEWKADMERHQPLLLGELSQVTKT